MVFGQIYVSLAQPMGTNQQLIRTDLSGLKSSSTDFSKVMASIAKKKGSKYNQMLRRTRLAAKIDAVSYVVIGLIIGLVIYYGNEEEERSAGMIMLPVGIAVVLAALSLLGAAFPVFAMAGYRSQLASSINTCGGTLGNAKAFTECYDKYASRQTQLEAARINANSRVQAANVEASAMSAFLSAAEN
tara:strand:- start:290 stop:850 length:561 start_codon:yes stop_codon:yes gene_type:complete